ncbi:biotin transporter BioY [Phycicoccus sp. Soil748]|uniref:biotin transporter BioY n=1 Tax=Intrasporangiaceae TaxID=85021 RepID=UPI0007027FB7|nr:biotin transporter BioY [Phycicoccus sp. Soil748]KRE52685.1 biotin biosynthesis protein BioY [Phycicoccus sp. Soil748]
MTAIALPRKRVLADVIPGGLVRDAVLVLGGAAFVGLLAQFAIPLSFTPVPLTLGTFAALLTGAALGSVRGLLSVGLYMAAGMAGVPWFAGHASGYGFPSFGYIIGFVAAGALVGWLAQRGADRTVVRTAGLMVLGNVVIYAVGLPYLMAATGMDLSTGLAKGVVPFLLGDAIKIAVAAGLLPAAWKLVQRVEQR